ncbi:DUF4190 domain-containing protein [Microbacterium sp. NPDC091313]
MSDSNPPQSADTTAGAPPIPPAPPVPPYAQSAPAAAPAPQSTPAAPPAYAPPAYAQPSAPAYAQPPAPSSPQAAAPYATAPAYAGSYGATTNSLAVVALVAGIANYILLFGVGAVVAVITGHIALKQLRTSGENGRGMALTGVILGWVGVGLTLLGVVFLIVWFVFLFGALGAASYSYS